MEKARNGIKVSGYYWVKLFGPDGELKDSREGHNVITTTGLEYLASFLQSAAAAASTFTMKYMAIGGGTTAEAAGNTALGTELARHTGTVSYLSGSIYQVTATFTTGVGTGDVTEYGIFSSSANGTMISRDVESAIAKGANDTLQVTAQISLA